MKKYFDHIQTKEPHERRQHAMQLAGVITAGVFAIWITTLGFRLSTSQTQLAQDENQTSLTAAAAQSGYNGPNQLIPAETSGF